MALSGCKQWGLLVLRAQSLPDDSLVDRRILLAEDEGLVALDLESMLQGFGCRVIGPLSNLPVRFLLMYSPFR